MSVVIPIYNRRQYLPDAIDSVLAQTYRPIEIIAVDDGSAEDIASVVAPYGDKVRYIRQDNGGISRARNTGITAAKGEYIALLDSDDRWLPEKLEGQIPLFDRDDVGLVFAAFRCFREDGSLTTYTPEHFAGDEPDFHTLLSWVPLGTQTLVFPRRIIDSVGLFDPELDGCEDHDFCLRIALKYRLHGLTRLSAEVRLHGAQVSNSRRWMFKQIMRVLQRHRGAHGDCAQCRQAAAQARRKHKLTYYRDLNLEARRAISSGRLLKAVGLAARAICVHPGALARIPAKILGFR